MENIALKKKGITPITDALTKLTDNVSIPVNSVGFIPDNLIPKIEWPRDYTLADYACEKIIERDGKDIEICRIPMQGKPKIKGNEKG